MVKQLFKAAMSGSAIRSGDAASSQITLGNRNGDPDYHRYRNNKHAKACKSTSSMADAFTMSDTNVQISCVVPAHYAVLCNNDKSVFLHTRSTFS